MIRKSTAAIESPTATPALRFLTTASGPLESGSAAAAAPGRRAAATEARARAAGAAEAARPPRAARVGPAARPPRAAPGGVKTSGGSLVADGEISSVSGGGTGSGASCDLRLGLGGALGRGRRLGDLRLLELLRRRRLGRRRSEVRRLVVLGDVAPRGGLRLHDVLLDRRRLFGGQPARRLVGRVADPVVVVEPPLLGLVDPRLGADPGCAADRRRRMRDADRRGLDRGVRQRHEAGLVAVDVDEHPFGAPGLAVEVDLTDTAKPLPARVEDVATGPIAVVAELGLSGKLGHRRGLARWRPDPCVGSGRFPTER